MTAPHASAMEPSHFAAPTLRRTRLLGSSKMKYCRGESNQLFFFLFLRFSREASYRYEKHQQGNAVSGANLQIKVHSHTRNVGVRHVGTIDQGHRVQATQDWEQAPIDLVAVCDFPSAIHPLIHPSAATGRRSPSTTRNTIFFVSYMILLSYSRSIPDSRSEELDFAMLTCSTVSFSTDIVGFAEVEVFCVCCRLITRTIRDSKGRRKELEERMESVLWMSR